MICISDIPATWTVHRLRRGVLKDGHVAIPDDWGEGIGCLLIFEAEHAGPPLVRFHSRCLYGESLGSATCDCRAQLQLSLELISADSAGGVLIYLEQEGRSAGLLSKAVAYADFEVNGSNTFEFYERHYGAADLRYYDEAVRALTQIGITEARLITNNPLKLAALEAQLSSVERIDASTEIQPEAEAYIDAKVGRGHYFSGRSNAVDSTHIDERCNL